MFKGTLYRLIKSLNKAHLSLVPVVVSSQTLVQTMINGENGEGKGGNTPYFRYEYRKIRGGILYNEPAIIHDGEILEEPLVVEYF